MKKKIYKLLIILLIIITSMFAGYENPKLVETPKKYVYFLLKKMNLRDNFLYENINKVDSKKTENKNKKITEYFGNSFSATLTKVRTYPGKSASLIMKKNDEQFIYEIYTRKGLLIKESKTSEINLPLFFYTERDGGVKSVFLIKDKYFALISLKKLSCLYAALIDLSSGKEVFQSKCLPDEKGVNFGGLGGAYVKIDDSVLLTIGVPTHISDEIDKLAQLNNSIFGKILLIKNKLLLNDINGEAKYNIFSSGHKNPQGLVLYENILYSLEHGPQGGDELNIIIKGKNYGWPTSSLGTKYNNGKSFFRSHIEHNFQEPIFTFLPAVAPSSLNICPDNLLNYYKNFNCLMGLSLKEMSLLIFLIDKNQNKVINVEKILIKKRLRHFGLDTSGKLFFDKDNYFYISSDNDGLYKVKFNNFR